MTDILAAATDRFCRRLRTAAALRSASQFAARGAVVFAVALVVAHLLSRRGGALDGGGLWGSVDLQEQVLTWLHGYWPWLLLAVAALLAGAVAWRRPIDRVSVCAHLEQRVGTKGLLLLVAEQGVAAGEWRQVLEPMLKDVSAAMPKLRVARLAGRPLLAAGALFALQWLPQLDSVEQSSQRAGSLAVERLAREVDEVCELPTIEPELRAELQRDVRELQRRLADEGAPDLWRAIDSARARIEREQAMAAAAGGPSSAGDIGGGGQARSGQEPFDRPSDDAQQPGDAQQLASALDQLGAADAGETAAAGEALRSLRDGLTPDQRQMLDNAQRPDGSYDASRLAAQGERLESLAAGLAEQAEDLLGRGSMEAAAESALQQLAELGGSEAIRAAKTAVESPDSESLHSGSPSAVSQAEGGLPANPEEAIALADDVLQGAAELMKAAGESSSGALPAWLHETMAEAAGGALDQLAEMDLETLRKLLPDDPAMLRSLVDQVVGAAESLSREGALPTPPSGVPEVSAETKQRLGELARGLKDKLGGMAGSGGPSPEAGPRGDDSSSGMSRSGMAGRESSSGQSANGESSRGSVASGGSAGEGRAGGGSSTAGSTGGSTGESASGRRSGNRRADSGAAPNRTAGLLDLTASSRGRRPLDPGALPAHPGANDGTTTLSPAPSSLPQVWQPTENRKAVPTVAVGTPAQASSDPLAPNGRETDTSPRGKAAANWQQRLLPRHRAIVRRFFGERRE